MNTLTDKWRRRALLLAYGAALEKYPIYDDLGILMDTRNIVTSALHEELV